MMKFSDLEAMGEDGYAEVGTLLWQWLRVVLFVLSSVLVAASLWFLPAMAPGVRYPLAVATVVYSTIALLYFVWSRLLVRCLCIELLRRHRHSTFWNGEVRGEIGARVAVQLFFALGEVVAGYVVLALIFGGAYVGIDGFSGQSISDGVYFSFVTFGTIGYGDFYPVGFGRVLVAIQSVAYLLYQGLVVGGVIAIIGKITTEPGIGLGFSIESEGAGRK